MIDWIIEFFKNNEFASGGFLLMMLGSIGASLYRLVPITFNFIKRKVIVTIEIPSYDESFDWFNKWLASIDYSKKSRLLTASSKYVKSSKTVVEDDKNKPQIFYMQT